MKNNFRFQLCCICMCAMIVAGCKVKRPDDVIAESKMENLLYDYHIAKAMGENLGYNENYKKELYMNSVFKKYETTEAVFDSSMVWYTRNTEILSKIYEKVNKRLKSQQDEINHLIAIRDKKPKTSAPGDSIDVWSWQRMARLTGMPLNDKFTFVLPADSNFKDRDTLVWEVRYRFLDNMPDAKKSTAVMAMQIVYENDSIISCLNKVLKSGIQHIRLQSDTLGKIKEVKGFIYYTGGKQSEILLADRIMLTRYHCADSLSAAARDSINKAATIKTDSLKKIKVDVDVDTAKIEPIMHQRLTPEEMNRKRTNGMRQVKPEQLQTEERIQEEKKQLRQERQMNQRRRSN